MDERQILLNHRCSILRIQTVDFVQLIRPVVTRFVECPTPHMREALSFTEIKLALLQCFFGALAVGDVLGRAKHFIRSARGITFYRAETVNRPNFAVGTNKTMFTVARSPALKRLL